MRVLLYILFLLTPINLFAQSGQEITICFVPTFTTQSVRFENAWYPLPSGDSVIFDVFRFYISDVVFYKNGKRVFEEKNSYHLMDAADVSSLKLSIQIPVSITYDEVYFNLGIDSITNTSGAMGGDLDPTKGMYWSWQSGYINLKLEGRSNLCANRLHAFTFHLGGYAGQFSAIQKVQLTAITRSKITIALPLDQFLNGIDLSTKNAIMIPGNEAVALSKKMAQLFAIVKE